MTAAARTTTNPAQGRRVSAVTDLLRADLSAGVYGEGKFIPAETVLAARHGVSQNTVHRALAALAGEGLLVVVPRHGYKVQLQRPVPVANASPLFAYLSEGGDNPLKWDQMMSTILLAAVQRAAGSRQLSVLATNVSARSAESIRDELRRREVSGILLDNLDGQAMRAVTQLGLPAILVSDWAPEQPMDSVIQDGFLGGMLMVQHLVAQGCRRPAWFGCIPGMNRHTLDRYSGFIAGLAMAGLPLIPEDLAWYEGDDATASARALLQRQPRPDGIAAPWLATMTGVLTVARELGLESGRDLQLVGWCSEDAIQPFYRPIFRDATPAPAVVWSPTALAETALCRLEERRRNPALPPALIKIPVHLQTFDRA